MRGAARSSVRCVLGLPGAMLLLALVPARAAAGSESLSADAPTRVADDRANLDDRTWVDHDRRPIRRPPDWEPSFWGQQVHQGFVAPMSHVFDVPDKLLWAARVMGARTRREAVNVNAFDEAPNSSWFTNRNHWRAVPTAELRRGPGAGGLPEKPWTIRHAKRGGWSAGFQIKDARGKKWLVKLDPPGHPQLSSGADMISRSLLHAAGYNVPHNEPVRFRRGDVTIDPDLLSGAKGELFTEADLDSLLTRGAVFSDGSHSAFASLFIAGHVLGSPSMNRRRPGDSNDWYTHVHRRELRGLFVLCSWINNWDTKDHQFLDNFVETSDTLGHVEHYILDAGASFGAAAVGPKAVRSGYEYMLDFAWIARRLGTLGFAEEPWRRARQESGIPSVGNYESEVYEPEKFRQLLRQPAFREMTDRDGYWGAKIVASFSDAQIEAAVDAARYEELRARDFLVRNLIVRRDKIARYWFARVAPLDFFSVEDGALRFHDLAVEIGLVGERAYHVQVESAGDRARGDRATGDRKVHLSRTELPLGGFGIEVSRLLLEITLAGSRARPALVELERAGTGWKVTRVRHG